MRALVCLDFAMGRLDGSLSLSESDAWRVANGNYSGGVRRSSEVDGAGNWREVWDLRGTEGGEKAKSKNLWGTGNDAASATRV